MACSEVRAELSRRGINTSTLIEKQEFQDALRAARYYENPEADVFCKVCGSGDDDEGNDILMCEGDGCKAAYHLQCLPSPLSQVPEGEWRCEVCSGEASRPVAAMKIGEIKAELLRRGVSTLGLLEKQELFEALLKAREGGRGADRSAAEDPQPKQSKPPKPPKSKRPAVDDDAKDDSSNTPDEVPDWRRKQSTKTKTKVCEGTLASEQPGKPPEPAKAQKRQRKPNAERQAQPQQPLAVQQSAQGAEGPPRWAGRAGILAAQLGDKLAGEVDAVVRMHDLETLTPKMVRAELEERLGLPAGSLKPQKDAISAHIDQVLCALEAEGGGAEPEDPSVRRVTGPSRTKTKSC